MTAPKSFNGQTAPEEAETRPQPLAPDRQKAIWNIDLSAEYKAPTRAITIPTMDSPDTRRMLSKGMTAYSKLVIKAALSRQAVDINLDLTTCVLDKFDDKVGIIFDRFYRRKRTAIHQQIMQHVIEQVIAQLAQIIQADLSETAHEISGVAAQALEEPDPQTFFTRLLKG